MTTGRPTPAGSTRVSARLTDPLGHYSPATLPHAVELFAIDHGFITREELRSGRAQIRRIEQSAHIDDPMLDGDSLEARLAFLVLLKRGAELGRDQKSDDGLSEQDREALRNEGNLFSLAGSLYAVIGLCCVGAALQGWDQTGSAAANLTWPWVFGLTPDFSPQGSSKSSRGFHDAWIVGIVNAMPYLVSPAGCLISDPLNHWLGRRKTIFAAAVFCFASVLGSATASPPKWGQLVACRSLLGIGMGLKASTVPLLASECSPSRIRGTLVMQWQLCVALGVFLGYSANLVCYRFYDPWRYQFGSAFIPAVPLMFGIFFVPESPRWLLGKGDIRGAYRALRKLRTRPVIACRDLFFMYEQRKLEKAIMNREGLATDGGSRFSFLISYMNRMKELVTIDRNRRATVASLTVMLAQQLCGINIMSFYSTTLYLGDWRPPQPYHQVGGRRVLTALLVSWAFGFCNFIGAFPAIRTIDTFGRRSLLLVTFPIMGLMLMGAALAFLIDETKYPAAHNGVVALFLLLFTFAYSPGEGPVPFTYAAEAFPTTHRDVGMSVSVSTNLIFAGLLTVFFPPMQSAWGAPKAVGFFAGLNGVAFVLIFLLVVETKQRTLEELTYPFSKPTRLFIKENFHHLFSPFAFGNRLHHHDGTAAPEEAIAMVEVDPPQLPPITKAEPLDEILDRPLTGIARPNSV